MDVVVEDFADVRQVSLAGKINSLLAPELENALDEAISGEPKHLIVNLRNVDYLSSAGVRSILVIAKRLDKKQRKLAFVGAQELVAQVIRLTGVDRIFPLCATTQEAREKLTA
jgi:anti-sigma B factor antagonist